MRPISKKGFIRRHNARWAATQQTNAPPESRAPAKETIMFDNQPTRSPNDILMSAIERNSEVFKLSGIEGGPSPEEIGEIHQWAAQVAILLNQLRGQLLEVAR